MLCSIYGLDLLMKIFCHSSSFADARRLSVTGKKGALSNGNLPLGLCD